MPPPIHRDADREREELYVPSSASRVRYFFGQLLTQDDLEAEQRYHRLLTRVVRRETLGTGTVAGLRLDRAEGEPRGLLVRAGLALDAEGRQLLLEADVCVRLLDAPRAPAEDVKLDGSSADGLATSLRDLWDASLDAVEVEALSRELAALGVVAEGDFPALGSRLARVAPPSAFVLPEGRTLREHLFDALVGTTYVGLRYAERGTDLAPAVLDASCCGDGGCFPSRTNEGVRLVLSSEPFAPAVDPYEAARAAFTGRAAALGDEDAFGCRRAMCDYLLDAWRPVGADSCETPVVPLGRVRWDRFDAADRILEIDNCTFRPLAPGVPPLRALHDVLSGCVLSVETPPRIEAVEPPPGARLGEPEVRLHANADLELLATRWELDVIARDPMRGPRRFSDASPPEEFGVAMELVPDASGSPRVVRVRFASPSEKPLWLAPGVYRLRVNLPTPDGEPSIVARATRLALDGTPHRLRVVPSGDGAPGGVFETTFYVPEES